MRSGNPCFSNGESYSPLAVAAAHPALSAELAGEVAMMTELEVCTPG